MNHFKPPLVQSSLTERRLSDKYGLGGIRALGVFLRFTEKLSLWNTEKHRWTWIRSILDKDTPLIRWKI